MYLCLVLSIICFILNQINCSTNDVLSSDLGKSPEILFCNSNREIRIVSLNETLLIAKPTVYKRQTRRVSVRRSRRPKSFRSSPPMTGVSSGCNNDIDYDVSDNYLVWSNVSSIIIAPLDKKSKNSLNITNKKILLSTHDVQRISLDWIHDLLYYVESGDIKVINVKTQRSKILIGSNIETKNGYYNAIDVVVNPIDSFIVWIRLDRRTYDFKLVKADQTGANQQIIVDMGFYGYDSQMLSPCCLSIDYETQRIYFVDNKLQTLESVGYDGQKRVSHLHTNMLSMTTSVDIYGDYIFWTNKVTNAILSTNKYGKSANIRSIIKSDQNIDSIRILHSTKQPVVESRCQSSKCAHLCLPAPNGQHQCVCDNDKKKLQGQNTCSESYVIVSNITVGSNDKEVEDITEGTQTNEILITENHAKTYPIYVFRCLTITDKHNNSIKSDLYTKDDHKLIEKFKKSPLAKNITTKTNGIQMKVSYPFIKQLDSFKCKSMSGNQTYETNYKIIVRQMPANPKVLSHSLSFAGPSKAYLTLQIENSKVEPPVDKYRVVYRGIFNYYQQEYWVDFNALNGSESDKNTIYVIKLDVDYASQDLLAFKIYAHNSVGWSYPVFN